MVSWVVAFVSLVGCGGLGALRLEGPSRVRVDRLGPVDGPAAVLPDGSTPEDVVWSAAPEAVAIIEAEDVVAVGPGEATVTGAWQRQSVQWTLVVEPAILLVPVDPPAKVAVGASVPIHLEGRIDDQVVPTGPITWSSSDASKATVSADGVVTGVAPGVVYVTASSKNGDAMIEITVE